MMAHMGRQVAAGRVDVEPFGDCAFGRHVGRCLPNVERSPASTLARQLYPTRRLLNLQRQHVGGASATTNPSFTIIILQMLTKTFNRSCQESILCLASDKMKPAPLQQQSGPL